MKRIATNAKIESHGKSGCRKANRRSIVVSFCAFNAARNLQLQAIMTSQAMKNAMPEIAENLVKG